MQTGDITVKETAKKPAATQTQTVSKIGQLNATNSGIKTTVYDQKVKMHLNSQVKHLLLLNNVHKAITHMS